MERSMPCSARNAASNTGAVSTGRERAAWSSQYSQSPRSSSAGGAPTNFGAVDRYRSSHAFNPQPDIRRGETGADDMPSDIGRNLMRSLISWRATRSHFRSMYSVTARSQMSQRSSNVGATGCSRASRARYLEAARTCRTGTPRATCRTFSRDRWRHTPAMSDGSTKPSASFSRRVS